MHSDDIANGANLGDYFVLLRRRWPSVLLCLLIGVAASIAYLFVAPKEYTAETAVLVTATLPSGTSSSTRTQDTINLDTEAQLVTATDTVAAAAKVLKVPDSGVADLVSNVGVTVPPNTDILDISYSGTSPADAQRGSKAFAQAYLDQRQAAAQSSLAAQDKALQQQIDAVNDALGKATATAAGLAPGTPDRARADQQANALSNELASLSNQQNQIKSATLTPGRIVTEPALPTSPSSPNRLIVLAAGVVLGLLVGLLVAMLRHRADDVVRRPEDVFRRTRLTVATVLNSRLHGGEVSLVEPLSADGRGYARLRNLVTTSLERSERRVVLVAGVKRGSGPVAANLAASLARAGEQVFLVCADVFGDTAGSLLGESPDAGLAEVLAGQQSVESVARTVPGIPTLRVLGAGGDPDRADALLQTRGPRQLVDRLLESATYVVLEAPATTESPDAQTLANVAELAVVVVEADATSAQDVLDACAQCESMSTPVLGAVYLRYGRGGDKRKKQALEAPVPAAEESPAAAEPAGAKPAAPAVAVADRPALDDAAPPGSDATLLQQDLSGPPRR